MSADEMLLGPSRSKRIIAFSRILEAMRLSSIVVEQEKEAGWSLRYAVEGMAAPC